MKDTHNSHHSSDNHETPHSHDTRETYQPHEAHDTQYSHDAHETQYAHGSHYQNSANRDQSAAVTHSNQAGTGAKPSRDEVARKAYDIYLKEGCPQGRDVQHWLEAEAKMSA
jgi:hypothetical protein